MPEPCFFPHPGILPERSSLNRASLQTQTNIPSLLSRLIYLRNVNLGTTIGNDFIHFSIHSEQLIPPLSRGQGLSATATTRFL